MEISKFIIYIISLFSYKINLKLDENQNSYSKILDEISLKFY